MLGNFRPPEPRPPLTRKFRALGVKPRTVQRRIAALEQAGLIQREERRTSKNGSDTNRYHLDGLIAAAKPYALEKLAVRKQRKAEDEKRRKKKGRPDLYVVGNASEAD